MTNKSHTKILTRELWLTELLAPQALPANARNSRELVCQAIEFGAPMRPPYSLVNPCRSDFFELAALEWHDRELFNSLNSKSTNEVQALDQTYIDEWSVGRQRSNGLFDQVIDNPLKNLDQLEQFNFPKFSPNKQFEKNHHLITRAFDAGKYIVGNDPVCLFDRLVSLTGLETALVSPYRQPQKFEALLDHLSELTIDSITAYAKTGLVQGFMTWQDFGIQDGMLMSMELFRKFYRPRLLAMIEVAHAHNMHFIWHCCGSIYELIAEMISMGVDVVQLDQARLIGHKKLADAYGGKICFWNALDTLWSAQLCQNEQDYHEDIRTEMQKMIEPFLALKGGLMLRHYPQPQDIGLAKPAQDVIAEICLGGESLAG